MLWGKGIMLSYLSSYWIIDCRTVCHFEELDRPEQEMSKSFQRKKNHIVPILCWFFFGPLISPLSIFKYTLVVVHNPLVFYNGFAFCIQSMNEEAMNKASKCFSIWRQVVRSTDVESLKEFHGHKWIVST